MTTEITTSPSPIQTAISAMQGVRKAFGAPGDHGYGTPEGDALFALYKAMAGLSSLAADPESRPAPDWTEAARHMLETWDHWFSGAPGGSAKRAEADRLARAGCFAAQAYCDALKGIGADGAPGVLMRTFLLALIDPMNPDLDHLRADPAAVAAWRAQQEQP